MVFVASNFGSMSGTNYAVHFDELETLFWTFAHTFELKRVFPLMAGNEDESSSQTLRAIKRTSSAVL